MIFTIKQLMAADALKLQVTSSGELYQVVIEADEAVKMTVTGTKDELQNSLIDHIKDKMKEIHSAKEKGMSSKIEPIKKPKPVATPSSNKEKKANASDPILKAAVDGASEEDLKELEEEADNQPEEIQEEKPKEIQKPQQASLF